MRFALTLAVTAICAVPAMLRAQFSALTPPACGKFVLATLADGSFACERYAVFPWFAAGGRRLDDSSGYVHRAGRARPAARRAISDWTGPRRLSRRSLWRSRGQLRCL